MGKRQQRIDVYHQPVVWTSYIGKEMNVVCSNGAVYHCVLEKADHQKIYIKDLLGEKVSLPIDSIKEIIIDFVTEY
jgi:FMN-dependent NADH-azoreductase